MAAPIRMPAIGARRVPDIPRASMPSTTVALRLDLEIIPAMAPAPIKIIATPVILFSPEEV
ncbi:hypothetical protein D3C76_1542630 [compost metagenome]